MSSDESQSHTANLKDLHAQLMTLPLSARVIFVCAYVGTQASINALRDTVLSKTGAWVLSCLLKLMSLFPGFGRFVVPGWIISAIIHVYFFLFRQSSWREAAVTLHRFLSRDDADVNSSSKFVFHLSDAILYMFLSVVFRNIAVIFSWLLSIWISLSSLIVLWFVTVDDPVNTFNAHVATIRDLVLPKVSPWVWMGIRRLHIILVYFVRFWIKCSNYVVDHADKRTAALVVTLPPYQYAALGPGEIRLLKLSKHTPWSPVRCELAPVVLDDAPPFETISYTWGSLPSTKLLILNNKRLIVSERVYDIVRDRASCLKTRYMWIDSTCINQRDDEEKSAQVQLMRKIYGSSYHTIVWLGHAPDANDAIAFIADIQRRIDRDDAAERASRPLDQLSVESPSWPALMRLIKHDYWSRCWVVQEIAVSKEVIVSYGGELLTWDYFAPFIEVLFSEDFNHIWHISKIYEQSLAREALSIDEGMQVASLTRMRELVSNNQSIGLFDLLVTSVNSTATDVRDNIYAVQGMSTAARTGDLMPDYTCPAQELYQKTAEYLVKEDSHASRLLHFAGVGFYRNKDFPTSWVPDWSSKKVSFASWRASSRWPYRASGPSYAEPAMNLSADGSTLFVKGVIVDEVKEAGPQFFGLSENGVIKPKRFPGPMKDYVDCREAAMNSRYLTEPYVTGIPLVEALWRTLMCDRTPENTWPADPVFFEHYQSWDRVCNAFVKFLGPDGDITPLAELEKIGESEMTEKQKGFIMAVAESSVSSGRFANISGVYTRERMFAVTERGYMGIVPPYSKVGDKVCIISGGQVPFLLRRVGDKWNLVGESYFHGMMDGEMLAQGYLEEMIELC
ncbi:putative heterokaryon incompatibility protein [Poronia punctata]|nr:putative heterokaryon incompatibility protein [Poronia punctata]